MEQFHRDKIRELSENLSQFREAVEVVAVTMETDTDIPTSGFRKNTRVLYKTYLGCVLEGKVI